MTYAEFKIAQSALDQAYRASGLVMRQWAVKFKKQIRADVDARRAAILAESASP